MNELPTDPNHHYHAVEANNRAWELSVSELSADEDHEMLTAAHTAFYHWHAIGTPLHNARAIMLLAEVHALLGLGITAWGYAETMKAFFLNEPRTPNWELALTYTIHAHAAFAAGQNKAHRESYQLAEKAIASITSEGDRTIVEETFTHVPAPQK